MTSSRDGESHWNTYHLRWARVGPPLRPDADVVQAFADVLKGHDDRVLLLGVTRELAGLGQSLTALDKNSAMIERIWPGDDARRKALLGDWLHVPVSKATFSAAIGDGSANFPAWPDGTRALLTELARVVEPGGIVALRVFLTPEYPEAIGEVREHAARRGIRSFHAFKWRLAMALVSNARNPNIAVTAIRDSFERMFPDRYALSELTGWPLADIETIDQYRDSPDVYSFPTPSQFRAAIPESFVRVRTIDAGSYELAERCPLIVMERE